MVQDSVSSGFDPVARTRRTEELIAQLVTIVAELESMHDGRKFALDGHLVGSIGEAAAEAMFNITLVPASSTGYDAVTVDGRKVEIKATFGTTGVAIRPTSGRHDNAALIVFKLSKLADVAHEVVYNGPLRLALSAAGTTRSNGQATMSLKRLRQLNDDVRSHERVQRRP